MRGCNHILRIISLEQLSNRNAGIANYPYFCKLFKKKTGVTPSQFRKINKTL
ncbi:MAG: AraC family transcriptional regulator [Oscillospiraceae bacterium]|nr:AraC family transcriptional regulator [Oscillospiraceae bacterium]